MRLVAVLLVTLFLGLAAQAEDPGEPYAVRGVAEFKAAYQAWDAARFSAAADLFRQAITNYPDRAIYHYWYGATLFHRVLRLQSLPGQGRDAASTDKLLDTAADALTRAVDLDERHAESHALLGTIYGMRIHGSFLRAVQFGPRLQRCKKLALQFGAENPRVHYLLGTCHFHTAKKPADYRDALAAFLRAETEFAREESQPAGPLDPRWGRGSCLTFTGRTYEILGQREHAAQCFRRALALHPADHFAREGLARVAEPTKGNHGQE